MGNLISFVLRTDRSLVADKSAKNEAALTPDGNPLPAVIHQGIKQQDLGAGRLIIIGDVHGCYDELEKLLLKLEFKHGVDNLVLVGDMVNKGRKSAEVVAAVRSWSSKSHTWCVRGNHDDAALAAKRQVDAGVDLAPAKKQKYHWIGRLQPEDVQFMSQLPFSLTIEGYNIIVIHAGLLPGVPLRQQTLQHLIKLRDVQQDEQGRYHGLEKPSAGSQAWVTKWQGPQHVFFGHDAKRRLQKSTYATGLDTGCVYGGQLTACVLPPLKELQQSSGFQAAAAAAACGDADSSKNRADSEVFGDANWLTLETLQAELVCVDAAAVYEQKK